MNKPTNNAPDDHTPNSNANGGHTAMANGHHTREQRRAAQKVHNGGASGPHTDSSADARDMKPDTDGDNDNC